MKRTTQICEGVAISSLHTRNTFRLPRSDLLPLQMSVDVIGAFITFRYEDGFNEHGVLRIAETARAKFEGMPGLRSKAFTVNSGKREATNFYVWDSESGAKAFFNEALLERITTLYGVRPEVEFVKIAALVENVRTVTGPRVPAREV